MKLVRQHAIVLGLQESGERSTRVEVLSAQAGREFFSAHGLRGSQKRFAGLDLFCRVDLELRPGKRGASLAECRLLDEFPRLRSDTAAFALACCDVEWARIFLRSGEGGEFCDLLYRALRALDRGQLSGPQHCLVWLHFLACLGFAPALSHCAGCATTLPSADSGWHPQKGQFYCAACTDRRWPVYPPGTIKTLQKAQQSSIEQLAKLQLNPSHARSIRDLLFELGQFHSGRRFRTRTFLEQTSLDRKTG